MFVTLTEYSHLIEKRKVYINLMHVVCFARGAEDKMTFLQVNAHVGTKHYYVIETPEEIMEMLEEG